jgi:hypothetical protein
VIIVGIESNDSDSCPGEAMVRIIHLENPPWATIQFCLSPNVYFGFKQKPAKPVH